MGTASSGAIRRGDRAGVSDVASVACGFWPFDAVVDVGIGSEGV